MKEIYLLTTEHLENCLWFRDEIDFKVAMNYVAIQAACCPEVDVLAFILMSNHVHFVVNGEEDAVVYFITQFKRRYSAYYRSEYGVREFLRRNAVDVKLIPNDGDAFERAIAYVQMNCVAANICAHPSQYQWGTGNSFFTTMPKSGRVLKDFSDRARKRMLRSDCTCLPGNWVMCEEGFVLPQSYILTPIVESIFRTPKRMNYFLNNSSKAKKRFETDDDNLPSFRDQTILGALPDLCQSMFHKHSFYELSETERIELVRQIRFRFSSDANQVARVCGITYPVAAALLDSM